MPRGGYRPGSGRKKAVPRLMARLDAGAYCENRWREITEQTAKQRDEKQFAAVRDAQERIQSIPLKLRRLVRDTQCNPKCDARPDEMKLDFGAHWLKAQARGRATVRREAVA